MNVTLAKKTDVNPHYIEADQGDQYATRISVNEVEVSVETANGGLSIETPFSAVAKPGALARFESPEVVEPVIGIVGMGADVVTLKLVDENGNPLANITTSYTINTEMTCTSDKAGTYFKLSRSVRRVFRHQWRHDRLRHQVADSGRLRFADTHDQEPFGWRCLSTGLILGNAIAANTTVTANAKGLSRVFKYRAGGGCGDTPTQVRQRPSIVMMMEGNLSDPATGAPLSAAKVGKVLDTPFTMSVWETSFPWEARAENNHTVIYWHPFVKFEKKDVNIAFSVMGGGSVAGAQPVGGRFTSRPRARWRRAIDQYPARQAGRLQAQISDRRE
ncbi:hypothetical protein LP419_39345 [Massilia sp. H-1]|nr:hypothetical protein LP419_39345 [Massilia sp. H-1]